MTKTKVKYILDSLLILQVVLHKWQKLFCILLLSLCQKVSCGILKEKEERKERKKERKKRLILFKNIYIQEQN